MTHASTISQLGSLVEVHHGTTNTPTRTRSKEEGQAGVIAKTITDTRLERGPINHPQNVPSDGAITHAHEEGRLS